jgi:hypothetical protein
LLIVTNFGTFIFKKLDWNYTIGYLNDPNSQNFLISGPFNVIAILGFFALFCYIFDILRTYGLTYNHSKEEKQIISPLRYLLLASLVFACFLIVGYVEGFFGEFTLTKNIEIVFIIIIALILLYSLVIFSEMKFKTYNDYIRGIYILDNNDLREDLETESLKLFFIIAGITIFGLMFFDILSIVTMDLMLLFIVGIIGSITMLPHEISNIKLKGGRNIPDVIILKESEYFISYLDSTNNSKRITIDSVESITDRPLKFEFDIQNPQQSILIYQVLQNLNKEISEYCTYILKISNVIIENSCYTAIIEGMFAYLILTAYWLFGWGSVFFVTCGIFGIPLLIFQILLCRKIKRILTPVDCD